MKIIRWFTLSEYALGVISGAMCFLMMILVTAEVIMRTAFNSPIPGELETVELMMAVIVFLGLAYTQSKGGHVRMDLIIMRISGRKRQIMEGLTLIPAFVAFAIVTWVSGQYAWQTLIDNSYAPGLINFPMAPSKAMVPIGGFFLCIRFLVDFIRHMRGSIPVTEMER